MSVLGNYLQAVGRDERAVVGTLGIAHAPDLCVDSGECCVLDLAVWLPRGDNIEAEMSVSSGCTPRASC